MPAALTSLLNESSSIIPPSIASPLGMHIPAEAPRLPPGNEGHPSRLAFDEIERLLEKPLPEPGNAGSPYEITGNKIRHQQSKSKRRASDPEKRSIIISGPGQPKYMHSANHFFVKVRNDSKVLLEREKSEYGKFNFTPYMKHSKPREVLNNITVGEQGSWRQVMNHTVLIQAILTQMYLCMNRRGRMYATKSPSILDECLFRQEATGKQNYYYYSSTKYPLKDDRCKRRSKETSGCRWYLFVREKNNVARLRAYKTNATGRPNKGGQFMEVPVTTNNYGTKSPSDSLVTFYGHPTTTPMPPSRGSAPGSRYFIGRTQPSKKPGSKRKGSKKSRDCNSGGMNLLSNCSLRERSRGGRKRTKKPALQIGSKSHSRRQKKGKDRRKKDKGKASIFNIRGR